MAAAEPEPAVMEPVPGQALARKISTEDLAGELMERAEADGVNLIGPGGLLADLTKRLLESMLEGEMTDHVGYEPYDPAGHHSGNSPRTASSRAAARWFPQVRRRRPGQSRPRVSVALAVPPGNRSRRLCSARASPMVPGALRLRTRIPCGFPAIGR